MQVSQTIGRQRTCGPTWPFLAVKRENISYIGSIRTFDRVKLDVARGHTVMVLGRRETSQ